MEKTNTKSQGYNFDSRQTPSGLYAYDIKTKQNIMVSFLFDDEPHPIEIYIDEYPMPEESLRGIFVSIGDEVVSIKDLVPYAVQAYLEHLQEGREYAREARYLLSQEVLK